jgi:hypothetical protein
MLLGFILVVILVSGFIPRTCEVFTEFFDRTVEAMR